jgi:hypothetical protein
MQKKIRNAQLQKVPFMVIAGDQDMEAGAVSFRYRDGTEQRRAVAATRSRRPSIRASAASRSDTSFDPDRRRDDRRVAAADRIRARTDGGTGRRRARVTEPGRPTTRRRQRRRDGFPTTGLRAAWTPYRMAFIGR